MKTFAIAAIAACAAMAAPAMAQAEPSFYGSVGYANVGVESVDVNLGLIQGRAGVAMNDYVSFEAEVGFGIADDTLAGVDVELKNEYGVAVVVKAPVTERINAFGRIGYVSYEVEASGKGGSASAEGDAAVFGLGAEGEITENDAVRAEYSRWGDDANVWAISYVRKF